MGRGPVLVTGWVGVIIENATGGYLNRCASDVIAVNSRSDLEHFRTVAGRLGLPADNLLLTGLPMLDSARQPLRDGPIRRVLFADQPTVPQRAEDRHFLYRGSSSTRLVIPTGRSCSNRGTDSDEDTFHRMRHHPASLLAGRTAPENFMIDYTSVTEQLPYTDLVLTVSSTACLEAIDHGCRVGLILDLGVHEKLGNHVFVGSGLLRTFAQIEADESGQPEDDWLDDYFFPRDRSAAQLIADRAEELLASGERPSRAARNTPYYTQRGGLPPGRGGGPPAPADSTVAHRLAPAAGFDRPRRAAPGVGHPDAAARPADADPAMSVAPTSVSRTSRDIPGWFFWLDRQLFAVLLRAQHDQGPGDLVELGTYLGKSAVVIGDYVRPGERFVALDLFGRTDLVGGDRQNQREVEKSYRALTRPAFEENYLSPASPAPGDRGGPELGDHGSRVAGIGPVRAHRRLAPLRARAP